MCSAFAAGQATLWTIPGLGLAHLETQAVAGDVAVHHDASDDSYALVIAAQLGGDADWQALGLRAIRSPALGAATFDLGPFTHAPGASPPLVVDLPFSACAFDQVALYDLASGATVATSFFQNAFEGGTWLCTTGQMIDPYDACGAAQPNDFQMMCP